MNLIENLKTMMDNDDEQTYVKDLKDVTISLYEPSNRNQTNDMIYDLLNNKAIIVNVSKLTREDYIRVSDVLLGAIIAIDGKSFPVSESVIIYVPKNLSISSIVNVDENSTTQNLEDNNYTDNM